MMMRSDLVYSMSLLSHYLCNSEKKHISLLADVFYYVSETLNLELIFSDDSSDKVIKYSDADFAEAVDDRKITRDFIFMLTGKYISYQSKWQLVIALLTCESEYITMSEVGKKAMWIHWFLEEIGYHKWHQFIRLNNDIQSDIVLEKNLYDNRQLKHIHTNCH